MEVKIKKRMLTSSCKNKGREFEQEIAELERLFTNLTDLDIKYTSMGVQGVDIQKSTDGFRWMPIVEECKWNARHTVFRLFEQVLKHAEKFKPEYIPTLFLRQNRTKYKLAVVDAERFIKLIAEYQKMKEELK